jgi:hypothetical protein
MQSNATEYAALRLPNKEHVMQEPRYYRDKAALCFEMARLMSDPVSARLVNENGNAYLVQAQRAEDEVNSRLH